MLRALLVLLLALSLGACVQVEEDLAFGSDGSGTYDLQVTWDAALLKRLVDLYQGPRVDLLPSGTDYHVQRWGESARFEGSSLRVPAGVLRSRPQDVASPVELARIHSAYRHRIRMGPTYRADMWAALEQDLTLSAAELARSTYGSFATAWQVKSDWELLKAS